MGNAEQHYWEEVPEDNQDVYRGFVHKLRIGLILSAIVVGALIVYAA